jgi:hypothetical protein
MSEEQVAEAPVEAGQAPSVEAAEFDFRQHIDEGLRDDPSLSSYKDINGMAKSLINAQKMVGADKVAIPGSWGTDADWSQVYDKLGRPAEASAYELNAGEESVQENVDWFKETAHAVGLNNNQAQQLLEAYNERMGAQGTVSEEQMEGQRVQLETDMRREMGEDFERNMGAANSVLEEFGGGELTELQMADGTLLGDNPQLIMMLTNLAGFMRERMGEDTFNGRGNEPGLSGADVAQKLSQITMPNSPYWDRNHPEHDQYVNEALRLRGL